jgi:hypothetical protein
MANAYRCRLAVQPASNLIWRTLNCHSRGDNLRMDMVDQSIDRASCISRDEHWSILPLLCQFLVGGGSPIPAFWALAEAPPGHRFPALGGSLGGHGGTPRHSNLSSSGHLWTRQETRGHASDRVRDREAEQLSIQYVLALPCDPMLSILVTTLAAVLDHADLLPRRLLPVPVHLPGSV